MLPVRVDGTTLWPGGRQAFCPSSPVYREHALRLCRAMAERYGGHAALALWHVGNELGCHNALCYCDVSAAGLPRLAGRPVRRASTGSTTRGGPPSGRSATTTSTRCCPRESAPAFPNPTQQLDFRRFSSDQLLANFVAERDVLHELSPGVPVTTNFMVMRQMREMDYFAWAPEVDLVSNDHYVIAADPEGHRELAFSADLVRGVAGGRPWLLMEQSTSAVNWQPRNVAKRPGELMRNCVAARRPRRRRAAVLPVAGLPGRGREVPRRAGAARRHRQPGLARGRRAAERPSTGSRRSPAAQADNDVAILFDWQAWWACELDSHPSEDVRYLDRGARPAPRAARPGRGGRRGAPRQRPDRLPA